jgi:predicted unusual protein kinase regulating ubiquinone biosynthesis (AarF/ABC1/UbiB family)
MGQVRSLTDEQRIGVAHIYRSLATGDKAAIMRQARDHGYRSKYFNEDVLWKMTVVGFDQDGRHVTEGLNLQQFIDKMYKTDPWYETDNSVIMPMRVSLMLRGIGLMLNHPVSVARAWQPFAEQALKEHGVH